MVRLDPRLLRELEQRGDANELIAEALGLCPTCGQKLPTPSILPMAQRPTGEKRAAVLAWRAANPHGNQSECARAVGCSTAYVGRIWHASDANSPQGEADE